MDRLATSQAWRSIADGALVVGPPEAGADPALQRLAAGPWPVGWLAVGCDAGADQSA